MQRRHMQRRHMQLSRVLSLVAVLLLLGAAGAASSAVASSPDIVVSQVYAGGGNAGASFANDFVELFNRGSAPVDVGSWSVQYASAGATSWQATPLSGTIAPGRFYLVSLASTAAVGGALPKADATDTTNLAASGGKVALVRDTAELTCGGAAGSCSKSSLVADLVGYGTATDYEGSKPAPDLDSTTAAVRAGSGCIDTDSSASDFTAAAAAPHNSASAALTCSGTTTSGSGDGKGVAVNLDVESALSISLDQSTLSFGKVAPGSKPAPLAEHVTVVSNDAAGYSLTVHRSAFAPADLPLAISAVPPGTAKVGAGLSGGALAPIPVPPAKDLAVGTAAAASATSGDLWRAAFGFSAPLPAGHTGLHTATVTFTVIGR
jgi:lamin tail-like protein